MPTFTTPRPVALFARFDGGHLVVTASARDETLVDVQPSRPDSDVDADYAAQTIVEAAGDEIRIVGPDRHKRFGRTPSIDVTVEVPLHSSLTAIVSSADVRLAGELATVAVTTASGDVTVGHAADCNVTVASGDVLCERVTGNLAVKSASGDVRYGTVHGAATVTTASGDIVGSSVGGDVDVRTASGDVSIQQLGGSVAVRTASGDARVAAVRRGTVEADTASGDIAIGVVEGSAAWLDVTSLTGDVTSTLDQSGPPSDDTDVVSIHARSLSGDIAIRRA
jgi:DUF4097 and DUF4098 domain-containing protein YvlB